MISKEEMKNYFLKANYQALRSEFRHDFHEITYFKPTFCNYCNGFVRLCLSFIKFIIMPPLITIKTKKLWGLIKQGWKCKDCGINAHRVCKDRIVAECRSKRNFSIPRQTSNSSNGGGVIGIGIGGAVGGSVSGPGGMSTVSSLRNRSLSRSSKRGGDSHPKLKQKGTQTEIYEDSFGSDEESLTSNEEIDNIQITADYADGI